MRSKGHAAEDSPALWRKLVGKALLIEPRYAWIADLTLMAPPRTIDTTVAYFYSSSFTPNRQDYFALVVAGLPPTQLSQFVAGTASKAMQE